MSEPLFKYNIRVSPHGRNLRLRVTFKKGLEVIVPRGYDTDKVPGILEKKKHWIRIALERAESRRKFFEPEPNWKVPVQIKLPALGKTWHIVAKESEARSVGIREIGDDTLLVFGATSDESSCRAALRRWLLRQTRRYLVPRLQTLSSTTGLRHKRTFVKCPKTRWASCSRRHTVSLNAKLLFLPPELVDYVMIHELCHIAEMNHSQRFWALVQHHSPDFRKLDSRLRDMWKVVPRWAS